MGDFSDPKNTAEHVTPDAAREHAARITNSRPPLATSARDISNDYVEDGGRCDRDALSGCFLSASQRQRLVSEYQNRVLSAQLQYQLALTDVEIDKLVEKDADLSWVFSLLADLVGLTTIGALGKAIKWLRDAPLKNTVWALNAADVETGSQRIITEADEMIGRISEKTVDGVVRTAVGTAKGLATSNLKALQDEAAKVGRSLSVSYIDVLKDRAAIVYQHLREDPVANATDGELVALFRSFDAEIGHTEMAYKQELKDKLHRFEASRIPRIGRQWAAHLDPLHAKDLDAADRVKTQEEASKFQEEHGAWRTVATRETKVAWVRNASSSRRTLVYMRQDFMLGTEWRIDEHVHQLEPVEDEFIDVAIQRHEAVWGVAPEEIVNDDVGWQQWLRGGR